MSANDLARIFTDTDSSGSTPDIIPSTASQPPPRQSRTLVLCFDGTSNRPIEDGTNVAKLFFALEKSQTKHQKTYYQSGIGTYVPPTRPLGQFTSNTARIADLAFAWFLQDHIIGGYKFLMNNYHDGDKIVIFGFSRGAYTCRALAAMISCVGLLNKDNDELIPFAYNLYQQSANQGPYAAASFRAKVSRDISVEFMGLWDTVASVGVTGRTLPSSLNLGIIKNFRQALALDERRAKFRQNPMHLAPEDISWDMDEDNVEPWVREKKTIVNRLHKWMNGARVSPKMPPLGPSPNARPRTSKDSHRDVWFAGTHSDVGGSETSKRDCHLANVTLFWMLQELQQAGVDLKFKADAFRRNPALQLQVDKPQLSSQVVDYIITGTGDDSVPKEDKEAFFKAAGALEADVCNSKVNESLKGGWYLVECIPTWKPYLDEHGRRCKRLSANFGRARRIDHENPVFHWSVALRRKKNFEGYSPRAVYGGNPVFHPDADHKISQLWAGSGRQANGA